MLKGCLYIVFCGMVMELFDLGKKQYIYSQFVRPTRLTLLSSQGVLLLVYPLLGYLADVCLNRYRIINLSFLFLICGGTVSLVSLAVEFVWSMISGFDLALPPYCYSLLVPGIGGLILVVGIGLYEANIIQFGLDQLLEAPTPKLITFIHWYYWAQSVGSLIGFYVVTGFVISRMYIDRYVSSLLMILAVFVLLVFLVGLMFFLFLTHKRHFYIQRPGFSPFTVLYRVLKYSWKHKVPENRSAFTYWEEDIPRRIDFGKNKYGGPFTNEEVEDTKTFLRILPLLLCLFGYHLARTSFSACELLERTSCPSLPVLVLITYSRLHISSVVTVIGIPLYRLVIKRMFPCIGGVLMLTRMWIGVFLSLLQVVLYIVIVLSYFSYSPRQNLTILLNRTHQISHTHVCFKVQLDNLICSSCLYHAVSIDDTYIWFIVPHLLNGLSSLLVSLTVLEFICAQAPRTTQGLLIGLWYATFSIRYLVVAILDSYITERRSWLIYEGVKGFILLVSLGLFWYVSRHYRYRQRDEIVNVQGMIEDTHERWFDQEEEYMQERRALLKDMHERLKI